MLQYLLCFTLKVPVLATNATGLSTGFTLAFYAATDTDSYAGGFTGLVTGASYVLATYYQSQVGSEGCSQGWSLEEVLPESSSGPQAWRIRTK